MTLQPLPASRHGIRLPCVGCKSMVRGEKMLADADGRAFVDFYCLGCAPIPQLQGCCSLPARHFDPAAEQMRLALAP